MAIRDDGIVILLLRMGQHVYRDGAMVVYFVIRALEL